MKKVSTVLFIFFLFISLMAHFINSSEESVDESYSEACDEFEQVDSTRSVPIKIAHRSFEDFSTDLNYCMNYELGLDVVSQSNEYRWNMDISEQVSDEVYWGNVYESLYQHDKGLLNFLEDSLKTLANQQQLTDVAFVHVIVSMVQDIPYNYVMPDDCSNNNDHPCIPNQRFGILSPMEFLYTLAGDCDTRTVLLYTLLRNLGFRPLIVNSNEYAHSMLAVNLPAEGDHLDYKGQSFYFWETTATGWQPGMIPPDMNNINYWNIILDYENKVDPARYR